MHMHMHICGVHAMRTHMRCACTHLPLVFHEGLPPAVCSRQMGAAARARTAATTCTTHAAAAATAAADPQPRRAVIHGAPPSRAHTAAAAAAPAAPPIAAGETEAAAADAPPPILSLHPAGMPFGGGDLVELACEWKVWKRAPMYPWTDALMHP
jgi:hypothetical protein